MANKNAAETFREKLLGANNYQAEIWSAFSPTTPLQTIHYPVRSQVPPKLHMKILIIGHTFVKQLFDYHACFSVNADIVLDGFNRATVDQVMEHVNCIQKNPFRKFDHVIVHIGCFDIIRKSARPAAIAEKIYNMTQYLREICGVQTVIIQELVKLRLAPPRCCEQVKAINKLLGDKTHTEGNVGIFTNPTGIFTDSCFEGAAGDRLSTEGIGKYIRLMTQTVNKVMSGQLTAKEPN